MSFHVFFGFSSGLARPMTVPAGTLRKCQEHVANVERVLGFESEQYRDNPPHWKSTTPKEGVTDKVFCEIASMHNHWVRRLYWQLGEWTKQKPAGETERLTPKQVKTFWHGLQELDVPAERWTRDYYVERMQHVYEVLRGNESEGVTFGAKALTPKQAAAVIRVIDRYIDAHDMRLEVPRGRDYLASSYDGGYDWCTTHGAVHPDDGMCCSKSNCENRQRRLEEDREYD